MKKLVLIGIIVTLLIAPMSALALEKMSGKDMGGVTGQAGVTIAFGGTTTTTISFSSLSWGDTDGLGALSACANSAGWLVIDGDIIIDQIIADGEVLTLDIGTTGGTDCSDMAADAVTIPANTTFIAVGLPTVTMSIDTPDTLAICLSTTAGAMDSTLGLLNLSNLTIVTGTPSTLYIWAH